MIVKRLLLAPVILLAAWMIAAFGVVNRYNQTHRAEQLTLGSIGEPDDLNPIVSQSQSSADVEQFIFNGLLKYDEHINVVGDLAQTYRLSQDSIAFFADESRAAAALEKLNAGGARWPEMKLASCTRRGDKVVLHFEDPNANVAGTTYEKALFEILDRNTLLPVTAVTITHDGEAKLPNGRPADTEGVKQAMSALAEGLKTVRIHEVAPINDSMLGVSLIGDAKAFKEKLPEILKGQTGPAGEVLDSLDQALLNEPIITFKLRSDARWQDGRPVTSADAAFTYRSLIDPQYRSPRGSDYWPVKDVQAPDPATFVVRYRYPYSECVNSWQMPLLPRHILEGRNAQWWADHYNETPVGTGPFRIVQWKRNEFIRLEANDDYFEGKPNLPAVVYRILPDPFVNQIAFDAKEFDTNYLLPYQVKRYEQDRNFTTFRRWGLGYLYVGWNLRRPLLADRQVRIALAHAVDVDRIIKYVYRGYARAANGTFPFQMWYANKTLQPFAHDPELAKTMLAQAGWRPGPDGILQKDGKKFEFTLITNNGNTLRAAIQMLIQDDLRKIGIKVNTATYEWAVFIKNYLTPRQFDACLLAWNVGYSYDQFQLWHSSQIQDPGLNNSSYKNPEADELLVKIRTTFDHDEIARLCGRLQKVIYDDQPYLFLCYNEGTDAMYRGKYVVRRPDARGGWIAEPVRNTDIGYAYYMSWWAPASAAPRLAP